MFNLDIAICKQLYRYALSIEAGDFLIAFTEYRFDWEVLNCTLFHSYRRQLRNRMSVYIQYKMMMQHFPPFKKVVKYSVAIDKSAASVAILKVSKQNCMIINTKICIHIKLQNNFMVIHQNEKPFSVINISKCK